MQKKNTEAMKIQTSSSKVVDFTKFSCNIEDGIMVAKTFPDGAGSLASKWNWNIVHRLALWACQEKLKKEVYSWVRSGLSIEEIKKKVEKVLKKSTKEKE